MASAMQFNLLTLLGLREHHLLLDIGCGSLRGGKLSIAYLLPGGYFGIEPEQWLVEKGIEREVGRDAVQVKRPVFSNNADFALSLFDQQFDFILAQSIFSHASREQIQRCLSEAKNVLKPHGIFAATFLPGDQDYTGTEWAYPECVTYRLESITKLVEEQGLVCKRINWHHPHRQTWIGITHTGRQELIPDLNDLGQLIGCRNKLALCEERLAKIEGHPYVRFGLKVYRSLRRLRGHHR